MCVLDIGERCEVWAENHRKAKKKHLCDSCRRVVNPGETYWTVFSVFQGESTSSKGCAGCEEISRRFAESHDGLVFAPFDIGYTLSECISDFDEDEGGGWEQDLDWINLGRWLHRKNKFNRTITSEIPCHS